MAKPKFQTLEGGIKIDVKNYYYYYYYLMWTIYENKCCSWQILTWYAKDICYYLVTWKMFCLNPVVIHFHWLQLNFDTDSPQLTRCASGNNEHSLHKVSEHKVSKILITLFHFFFSLLLWDIRQIAAFSFCPLFVFRGSTQSPLIDRQRDDGGQERVRMFEQKPR